MFRTVKHGNESRWCAGGRGRDIPGSANAAVPMDPLVWTPEVAVERLLLVVPVVVLVVLEVQV